MGTGVEDAALLIGRVLGAGRLSTGTPVVIPPARQSGLVVEP